MAKRLHGGVFYSHETRAYPFHSSITFHLSKTIDGLEFWEPHDHTDKVNFVDYDQAALTRALKETNYFDFAKWIDATLALMGRPSAFLISSAEERKRILRADTAMREEGVLGLLADPDKWEHLLYADGFCVASDPLSTFARSEAIKSALREAIYELKRPLKTREVSWFDGSQYDAQRRLRKRWERIL